MQFQIFFFSVICALWCNGLLLKDVLLHILFVYVVLFQSVQNENRFNSFLRLIRIKLKLHDLYDIDNFCKYLFNNNQLKIPFQNETD